MIKGQIFSMDFLFSMIIVILFIGLLLNTFETRSYQIKEDINTNILIQKVDTAFIILTNGKYSCETDNGIKISFSINEFKLTSANLIELKKYLGLEDNNILLRIGNEEIFNEISNVDEQKKIHFITKEILNCNDEIEFSEFEKCLKRENCNIERKNLTIGVIN